MPAPHPACRPPSPRRRGEGDSRQAPGQSPLPARGERVRSDAGLDPLALAADAAAAGLEANATSSVAEALGQIAELTDEDPVPPRVLIGGSLYLVGDVLAENGTPPR
ncbi:hypothetical protein T190_21400 [Sinorhizobium meliloti CCBAU 01290]|nr:hypothetical protein T190_21400 [Sinorhizobium meliloti CCBAU 01290]